MGRSTNKSRLNPNPTHSSILYQKKKKNHSSIKLEASNWAQLKINSIPFAIHIGADEIEFPPMSENRMIPTRKFFHQEKCDLGEELCPVIKYA